MRGIGNYRAVAVPQIERRAGTLLFFQGPRATIGLGDGQKYAMPAEPFRKLGMVEGDRFIMITTFLRGKVQGIEIQRPAESRPVLPRPERSAPKVFVRDGLKFSTRR